jgi:hypothetical protein
MTGPVGPDAPASSKAGPAHVDFEEGRRLRAADLNAESQAHAAESAAHVSLAHPGRAAAPRLVGESLTHPRGNPALEVVMVGPGAGIRVTVGDPAPVYESLLGRDETGASVPRHHVAGKMSAGGVAVDRAVRLRSRPIPEPPAAAPWSVRAVDVLDDDGALAGRELRIELSAPPGFPASESRVSVGVRSGSPPTYDEVLIVDADGNVTVEGDLEVAGSVSQGEMPPDTDDPRFAALLTELVARRVVGAAATSGDTVLDLKVTPVDTVPGQTTLTVSIKPSVAMTRYGAAWQTLRAGSSAYRLIAVGGPVAAAPFAASPRTSITTAPVEWDPPLSHSSTARIVVVVAGFDAQGALHAQRFESADLEGHP